MSHLDHHKILTDAQHGFCKQRSFESQLILTVVHPLLIQQLSVVGSKLKHLSYWYIWPIATMLWAEKLISGKVSTSCWIESVALGTNCRVLNQREGGAMFIPWPDDLYYGWEEIYLYGAIIGGLIYRYILISNRPYMLPGGSQKNYGCGLKTDR